MERVTIEDIIAAVDSLYPNTYERKDKEKWINDVERRVQIEIVDTHENPDIKKENELYVTKPYTDVYVYYLEAQIDKHNTEYDRYSNHMSLFNSTYQDYAAYYNRTHMPIDHGRFKV